MSNKTRNIGNNDDQRSQDFVLRGDGLYLKEGVGGHKHKLGDYIKPLGHAMVEGDEKECIYVVFRDRRGKKQRTLIPVSDAQLKGLAGTIAPLVDGGYRCSRDKGDMALIVEYLISTVSVKKYWYFATNIGWHDKAFLLPNQPIFQENKTIKFLPSIMSQGDVFQESGTLKKWQKNVASLCCSSRLKLALCFSFAAPIRHFTNVESGGIHIHGTSSAGKTTCLLAALSVSRKALRNALVTWDMTATGGEEIATQHAHILLGLDELGRLEANNPAERANKARQLTFLFGGGRTRVRSRAYDIRRLNSLKRPTAPSVLVISTGEASLSEQARDAGMARLRGEEVRLIDLPAVPESGVGIYDEAFPEGWQQEGEADQQAAARLSEAIETNCSRFYGTAVREFVAYVEKNYDDMAANIEKLMGHFESYVQPTTGWERRFLRRFALAYAAGVVAIDAGVLPWTKEAVAKSILACYRDAWGAQPDPEAVIKSSLRSLRRFLHSSLVLDKNGKNRKVSKEKWQKTESFRMVMNNGQRRFMVKPASFHKLIEVPEIAEAVLGRLLSEGTLVPDKGRNLRTRQIRIPGIKKKSRYYVLKPRIIRAEAN